MANENKLRLSYDLSPESPRRTTRTRNKPIKYSDFLELSPMKKRIQNIEDVENCNDDDDNFDEQNLQKPTALFSTDDVEGQDMFKFKSRHTKHDLQNKVKSAASYSPRVVITPIKKSLLNVATEATPKHVKNIIKKRIIREVESDSADSDFSASSSDDFIPGEESEKESVSSDSGSTENEEELPKKSLAKVQAVKEKYKTKQKDAEYYFTPDNYFTMHSSKKITTSDHTLARLKNLNITEHDADEFEISRAHQKSLLELNKYSKGLFHRWLYVLSENFNILLYGVGSKQSILQQFQKENLEDFPCIVVNGFFPSLTIKSILETIVIDLLDNSHMPSNIGDVVNLIDVQLRDNNMELFLIIHNIDGAMLRNAKAQSVLASISQLKNVHVVATIDHINAPLLWDHSKLSKFKFTWWDVTTFLPYTKETSFENSLMSQRSGALQLSSLGSVYQSLTSNAKGVFNIIIRYQLENQKHAHYQGLPYKDLYSKCREQFLVSSDLALRAQLTEFLDHKLVRMKRTYDGSENLLIPIENSLLQQFLDQQCS